jgi:putative signal transducing protein
MALVELAKFYNGFEAGLARGRLEAEGIESHLFDFNAATEGIGFLVPVRLMVDEDDLDAARTILSA